MTFKKGDYVKCIDAEDTNLELWQIYRVEDTYAPMMDEQHISVSTLQPTPVVYPLKRSSRFIKAPNPGININRGSHVVYIGKPAVYLIIGEKYVVIKTEFDPAFGTTLVTLDKIGTDIQYAATDFVVVPGEFTAWATGFQSEPSSTTTNGSTGTTIDPESIFYHGDNMGITVSVEDESENLYAMIDQQMSVAYDELNLPDFCLFVKGAIMSSLVSLLDEYYDPQPAIIYLDWLKTATDELDKDSD